MTLFKDNEVFMKERPTKMTEEQSQKLYLELASEVKSSNWSSSDEEDIAEDLEDVNSHDNGYEIAKDLESSGNASYDIDVDFCEFLESLDHYKRKVVDSNVKAWVEAHDIKHKIESKTKIKIVNQNRHFKVGMEMYIVSRITNEAKYVLNQDINGEGGRLVPYEDIEAACEIITE